MKYAICPVDARAFTVSDETSQIDDWLSFQILIFPTVHPCSKTNNTDHGTAPWLLL